MPVRLWSLRSLRSTTVLQPVSHNTVMSRPLTFLARTGSLSPPTFGWGDMTALTAAIFSPFCSCRFVHNFAHKTNDLTALLKKRALWQWGPCEQAEFLEIRGSLLSPLTLINFNDNTRKIVHSDASQIGLGAALLQEDVQGEECVIAYASRQLSEPEMRYH